MHAKVFSIQIFQYFRQIPSSVCTLVLFIIIIVSRAIRVFNVGRRARILAARVVGENTSGVFRTPFVCSAGMLAAPIRLQNY